MPCSSSIKSAAQAAERKRSLDELDADIAAGRRSLARSPAGEVTIVGWADTAAAKSGWCDGCAMRALQQQGSWATRTRLASVGVVAGKGFVSAGHGHGHKH
jgi:hypothetical protein